MCHAGARRIRQYGEKMKFGVISLGCDKNRVDSEKMIARLVAAGHTVVSDEEEAQVVIINTCAFTDAAKSEAIDEILDAISRKKADGKIVVTGCLPQRYIETLEEEFPEVDAFFGVADYDELVPAMEKIAAGDKIFCRGGADDYYGERVLTTPYHYAYLKIAEGCDNHCTYCAIPSIRGKYRSESMEHLLAEAKKLSDDGVKELILVAQDVTRYGVDFDGKPHLTELVRELEKLDFEWIRLLYLEPEMVTDELIEFVRTEPKVCKYMDVPLQHVDDGVLKRMNRHTTEKYTRELVAKIKAAGITMRTSFISGFPGETEEAHRKLADFIREAEIDFAGIFAYSREEGTPADRMRGHMDEAERERRADELRAIEQGVIERKCAEQIGKVVKVIYDGIDYDRQSFYGRTERQSPEIDSVVYFTSPDEVRIGEFYDVEIISADGIDFIGRTI